MIDLHNVKSLAGAMLNAAPFISKIDNDQEYQTALKLMDMLIDDYENQRLLVNILARSIGDWEDNAEEFVAFNQS